MTRNDETQPATLAGHSNRSAIVGIEVATRNARDGAPPVEVAVNWIGPKTGAEYTGEQVTLGVQRDCDPTKIALYTLVPDERWSVSSYTLTEEQAIELATGLLVAVAAGPWVDPDEDEEGEAPR